ncbi:DeoR/GlpR family DNA-binding transcription regulator [Microvirga puerhi]|uniref:DeoR/GlpR family DNA-binding transcription regulator n=1 Tax=Microvirga puerhi TaxID=2876078 RepID=A0ABS7VR97_9HYPH|nr:DeoR/GlpR family DNA-binding transcription regulator [Microvirga puerhi]MBZ6078050.1 DeoR/GlpR family DNA-binding transcription regulator [Microvirga puerhi]
MARNAQVKPLAALRHGEILKRIATNGFVAVNELATYFGVSHETIRRDLKQLADRKQLEVIHGGASRRESIEPDYEERVTTNAAGKAAIAKRAAALIEDGMVLLLDSGTTTLALASALKERRNLTICTGSLSIAHLMARMPDTRVHLLGGEVDPREEATVGVDMLEAIARFRVDMAFIGVGGVSPKGEVTDYTRIGAEQRARMISVAHEAYFLVDHEKFGRLTALRIPGDENVAGLVTDRPPTKAIADALQRRGIPLLTT